MINTEDCLKRKENHFYFNALRSGHMGHAFTPFLTLIGVSLVAAKRLACNANNASLNFILWYRLRSSLTIYNLNEYSGQFYIQLKWSPHVHLHITQLNPRQINPSSAPAFVLGKGKSRCKVQMSAFRVLHRKLLTNKGQTGPLKRFLSLSRSLTLADLCEGPTIARKFTK